MRRNYKSRAILIMAFLLALFSGGCAKREIANLDSKGKNIICFGDSITFGYGAEPGGDYPSALSKMLTLPVINAGIDGDTSSEALRRLETDVLDREPLLVIIEFGGNDFLRKIPDDVTLDNMRKIIEKVQAQGAMAAIVDISTAMVMRQYYSLFYSLAREKGAIFIPRALSGIITNPRLKSDFIHPNADGYSLISQRIHRAISPYLIQNSLRRKISG
ncbi:MAG: GDSL-type esterase/lipase family protein [Candidatus Omnitrophica bacterium]|nr:GDSL-type esterase/lipase family protein [Candidatus Omnitrophota bacterium]MDD5553045.1 GDSL-type esterase/lipase family protein [Candidatus Omnitrophota bacterium]